MMTYLHRSYTKRAAASPVIAALVACVCAGGLLTPSTSVAQTLTAAQVKEILTTIDDRQRNSGDWKARVLLDQREKDKNDVVYDLMIYRRDRKDMLLIHFLRPKTDRGKGYLRIDKNLWFYDPGIGKWERRTERERIGGTGSNRQDFDESRLAVEYVGKHAKDAKLGKYSAYVFNLRAKPGFDVAYPRIRLWVDKDSKNILKAQDFAASGRLMRTTYYPKWRKIYSPSKKADVWFPKQIRIFDELEKGNRTLIVIRAVDLNPLPKSIFTKAWLERRSR
jgi:outer membrane lipoprotein-sorting protein